MTKARSQFVQADGAQAYNPLCHRHRPFRAAVQSKQGLSAEYESIAFCKHRPAADKRYSLGVFVSSCLQVDQSPVLANVACYGYRSLLTSGESQMTTPVHELEAEVLSLAAPDRARILERLIESFDRDTKIDEAWLDEALRREEEVVSGKVAMVPGREAVARIRAQLT